MRNWVRSQNCFEQRGLARTRRTNNSNKFSTIDLHIHVIENGGIAVGARNVLAVDQRTGTHVHLLRVGGGVLSYITHINSF